MSRLAASAKGTRMPQKEVSLKDTREQQFKAAVRAEQRRREKQDAAARAEAMRRAAIGRKMRC